MKIKHLNRRSSYYRVQSKRHSKRKIRILRDVWNLKWHRGEHYYSKNKVHCSCWLCRFHGPSHSDMMKAERDNYSLRSYKTIESEEINDDQ